MTIGNLVPWKRRQGQLDVRRDSDMDSPFGALSREMNRLFEEFHNRFDLEPFGFSGSQGGTFWPSIDVTDHDTEVRITGELPGMDAEDIDISIANGAVTIHGEKKQEKENSGKDHYRMERSYGSFSRTVPLPTEVDEDKVQADFKNGVLTICLPKTEAAKKNRQKNRCQMRLMAPLA